MKVGIAIVVTEGTTHNQMEFDGLSTDARLLNDSANQHASGRYFCTDSIRHLKLKL